MHLFEPVHLINMLGVHFMMTTVISDNEFSDGWRPVSAHDIRSHVKGVNRQPQEPGVSMATELNASFYLKDENA